MMYTATVWHTPISLLSMQKNPNSHMGFVIDIQVVHMHYGCHNKVITTAIPRNCTFTYNTHVRGRQHTAAPKT